MKRRKFLEVRNIDRAKLFWNTLGDPIAFEWMGFDSVEHWEQMLDDCHEALMLAIEDHAKD